MNILVRVQGAVLSKSIGRPVAAIVQAANEHRWKRCNAAIEQKNRYLEVPLTQLDKQGYQQHVYH